MPTANYDSSYLTMHKTAAILKGFKKSITDTPTLRPEQGGVKTQETVLTRNLGAGQPIRNGTLMRPEVGGCGCN